MTTNSNPRSQAGRKPDISCSHYEPLPGRRHCRHYETDGACSRPGEFMCGEWLKANGHLVVERPLQIADHDDGLGAYRQALASSPIDLFGNPNPDYVPVGGDRVPSALAGRAANRQDSRTPAPRRVDDGPDGTAPVPSLMTEPGARSVRAVGDEPERLRGLTTEDIDSFKALRAEVCITTAHGDVWLVPARTGQPRRELTPEQVATIVQVLSAFPGSRVVDFTTPHEPAGSKEQAAS